MHTGKRENAVDRKPYFTAKGASERGKRTNLNFNEKCVNLHGNMIEWALES